MATVIGSKRNKVIVLDTATIGTLNITGSIPGYASEAYVGTQISNLVDSSPAALNTLNELAAALGDDPNFATTVSTSIGTKLPLSGGTLTGALLMDSANAEVNLKAGVSGTSGAVNWTFNTNGTNYASIKLPYDTRASTGLHIDAGYPITIDSSSSTGIKFVVNTANKATINSSGLTVSGTVSATGGNSGNWNTAYGWGDHSTEGYLTSYTDTNTTYSAGTGITLTGTTFSLTDTNAKLNLAGGTMTGKISMFQNNEIFGLSGTIANYPRLSFNSSEGTHSAKTQTLAGDLIGQIDFNPYTGTSYTGGGKISFISTEIITSSERGTEARIYSTKTGQSFLSFHQFKDDELYIKNVGGATHKYWHAGNDGGGSGLDADKLDGQQGSYYAAASHVHSYLPLSGGTLTGELKVNAPLTIENPVGTGRVEIGTIRNDQQNGYVRGSIIMSRDEDQITYNGTTDLWVHAGGGSTDWSMISHTTAGTNFYTGPTVSAETTYTNTAFDTAYRWLSVSNSSHVATFKSRPKVGTNNIWHSGDFANNSANWNTAYGWGDHSTQSYATQSYVGTQISNLVDSSPATLDTLNELAAALGDDPNFATTVTNSIATKLPLSGGTLTGALTATNFVQSGSLGNSFYGASFTRSAGGTTTPDIWGANGTLVLGTSASVEAVAFSGANARFYGNVGIGTSSPTAKADLVGGDVTGGLKISADKTTSAFFAFGADANETRITSSSYGGFKPLTVHTGGAERMRIDSAGNVGIGTSSPTAKLEVTGVPNATIQPSNAIIKMNSSGGNGLYMGNVGASTYASYIQAAFVSADIPNVNYNLLLQPNGGNVGIGTSSPNYPLDVRNSSDINQTFRVFYPDASTVEIGTSRMSTGVQQGLFVNAQTLIKFGISGIEKARINSAGNLGIGTNSPMAKLHVDGAIVSEGGSFTSSQETATDAGLIIQKNDYIYSDDSDYLRRIIGHASTGIIEIGQGGTALISDITLKPGSTGNIRFFGSGSEDVRINSAGNMGIGTTAPKAKLQVEEYGVDTTATSTAAITQVAIDSFPAVDFRSARYTIQVTNTTDGTYHLTELFMIHDGTTTNTSEFGSIFTGAAVEATFDADILSGNVRLLATPTSTDAMAFKVVRHSITV